MRCHRASGFAAIAVAALALSACNVDGVSGGPLTAEEQKEAIEDLRVLLGTTELVLLLQGAASQSLAPQQSDGPCAVGGTTTITNTATGFILGFEACDDGEGTVLDGTLTFVVSSATSVTILIALSGSGPDGAVFIDGSGVIDVAASVVALNVDSTAQSTDGGALSLAYDMVVRVAADGLVTGGAEIFADTRAASCVFTDFDIASDDAAYDAACGF